MYISIITIIILTSQWVHYLPNSFGSISSSLGGTPVAFYDCVEYGAYNPAALTGNDKISASINYKTVSGEGYYWENYQYSTSEHFMDFVGFAFPFNNKFYFGAFFSIPYNLHHTYPWEIEYVYPEQEDTNYYRYSSINRFYSITPSVGFQINEHFSIGLSVSRLIKKEKAFIEFTREDRDSYNIKYN